MRSFVQATELCASGVRALLLVHCGIWQFQAVFLETPVCSKRTVASQLDVGWMVDATLQAELEAGLWRSKSDRVEAGSHLHPSPHDYEQGEELTLVNPGNADSLCTVCTVHTCPRGRGGPISPAALPQAPKEVATT